MDAADRILNVSDLTVKLEGRLIFENLNFSLVDQETLVILGANGAGKTVLLRSLLGLLPYSGQVEWRTGTRIGYVPQRIPLNRELPITIADFFKLRGRGTHNLSQHLASVGLTDPDFCERQLGLLSSGQFQRVLIAWALLNDPDVLLFDEPMAGVDIGAEDAIHDLLHRTLGGRPMSIILVTHDLSAVYSEATNVLCLNQTTACYGKPQTVLDPETLKRMYGTEPKYYRHSHG